MSENNRNTILSCDWTARGGISSLVSGPKDGCRIATSGDVVTIPIAWHEYVFGLVAIEDGRFIVWPVGPLVDGFCKMGLYDNGGWREISIGIPKLMLSCTGYVALTYGEEWACLDDPTSMYSGMTDFLSTRDFSSVGELGSAIRGTEYEGIALEIGACCFDIDANFYFTLYDTPYIWVYDLVDKVLRKEAAPVDLSSVVAVTKGKSRLYVISGDQNAISIYSKSDEGGPWRGPLLWTDEGSKIFDASKANWLGKPEGRVLIYNESASVVMNIESLGVV